MKRATTTWALLTACAVAGAACGETADPAGAAAVQTNSRAAPPAQPKPPSYHVAGPPGAPEPPAVFPGERAATPPPRIVPQRVRPPGPPSIEGRYELLAFGGVPATRGKPSWVLFDGGELRGFDGCGSIKGRYTQTGKSLKVTGVGLTATGCNTDYDRWRSRVLRRALSTAKDFAGGSGGSMILYGPHGSMDFVPPSGAEVVDDRRLEGEWRMATLAGRPVPVIGENTTFPVLRFDEGTYQWTIGCNIHSGYYRMEAGGRVTMRPSVSTQMMCSQPEERLMERTVGGRTAFRAEGARVVLETPSGPLVLEKVR